VEIDPEQLSVAQERLTFLGGLTPERSKSLVEAVIGAATDHAFELINGSGSVPTAMSTSKADQLRFICERAGRLLTQREVEIVFRVTGSAAKTILNVMTATYEQGLQVKFLERMRGDAKIKSTGTTGAGQTWTITFIEESNFDIACNEIIRQGLDGVYSRDEILKKIVIPKFINVDKRKVKTLQMLGLAEPK